MNGVEERDSQREMRIRHVRHLFTYLLAGIVTYYFIMSSLAPVRYVRNLNLTYGYDTLSGSTGEPGLYKDSLFLDLSAGISFLNARTKMSSSDSVGLSINLSDSLIALEIKGVTVREVPVISYRPARSLSGITGYALVKLLSEPLAIISSQSTIPKEPIIVTRAPRDTTEASARPNILPDTTAVGPVCFALTMNNGISLVVIQETSSRDSDFRKIRWFLFRLSVSDTWRDFKRTALFRIPEFEPEIRIVVPKSDARVIYRSIPARGEVALRIR